MTESYSHDLIEEVSNWIINLMEREPEIGMTLWAMFFHGVSIDQLENKQRYGMSSEEVQKKVRASIKDLRNYLLSKGLIPKQYLDKRQ
jgi:hypothetical protein